MREAILNVVEAKSSLDELMEERSLLEQKIKLAEFKLLDAKKELREALPDNKVYVLGDKGLAARKDLEGRISINPIVTVEIQSQ
ncbi:MAG: hypothetical protein KME60_03460 [Cyanomargarita calcarea GSE-NOS-MK-12-04C]|jgi:hypothetical protein|uniref:Uncharacterized protein n=1 Tax=Cyanomargarita calcarea GSE-NOS-MK-12-04C TaxID=2839659 RepID=A0A951QHG6_9CYAN|nr:hypothetical protein [Cyanomargarita calcarea GSE-NOS-MK-12-04C]